MSPARAVPGRFPPLQRVGIEMLACCDPIGLGLHMTHWSTRSLAKVAAEHGLVSAIAHSTVSLILRNADLQPHRSRYWKTSRIDANFLKSAARVLWCYERTSALAARGELVLCLDEKPNIQLLEREHPTRRMQRGQIERQEFEYIRHGTVNLLVALVVHTGEMRAWTLAHNDGGHLRTVLPALFDEYRHARRIHLIWDCSSVHISSAMRAFLHTLYPHVRVINTPPHASWLNQAELLLRAFTTHYLKRGNWSSRQQFLEHIDASWREYNRLFARPFTWSWTRQKMRRWAARRSP